MGIEPKRAPEAAEAALQADTAPEVEEGGQGEVAEQPPRPAPVAPETVPEGPSTEPIAIKEAQASHLADS